MLSQEKIIIDVRNEHQLKAIAGIAELRYFFIYGQLY